MRTHHKDRGLRHRSKSLSSSGGELDVGTCISDLHVSTSGHFDSGDFDSTFIKKNPSKQICI
jgi:hypothetical protein